MKWHNVNLQQVGDTLYAILSYESFHRNALFSDSGETCIGKNKCDAFLMYNEYS